MTFRQRWNWFWVGCVDMARRALKALAIAIPIAILGVMLFVGFILAPTFVGGLIGLALFVGLGAYVAVTHGV